MFINWHWFLVLFLGWILFGKPLGAMSKMIENVIKKYLIYILELQWKCASGFQLTPGLGFCESSLLRVGIFGLDLNRFS